MQIRSFKNLKIEKFFNKVMSTAEIQPFSTEAVLKEVKGKLEKKVKKAKKIKNVHMILNKNRINQMPDLRKKDIINMRKKI